MAAKSTPSPNARQSALLTWLESSTALAGPYPLLSAVIVAALLAHPAPARANPKGGTVVSGSADIIRESDKKLVINQHSNKTEIHWQSFNIGADEHTHFQQPSPSAIALNRVTGGNAAEIAGRLTATGNIWIVNQNGVYFSKTARVDVNGLLTSTHDITSKNFHDGNYTFDIPGMPNATIVNEGTITVRDGGIAVLVAPGVRNAGAIYAKLGKVGLGAARAFTLDMYGDDLIVFETDSQMLDRITGPDGKPLSDAIRNDGRIEAAGGVVILTADVAKGVVDNVINMDGIVKAQTVEQRGGAIVLRGGDAGVVRVAGELDASGTDQGEVGGDIVVDGNIIHSSTGSFDVRGAAGGGSIAMGTWQAETATISDGSSFDASATESGDGGTITIIAKDTDFSGSALSRGGQHDGDGGLIETSGNRLAISGGMVNTGSPRGNAGTWLLDPYDLTVDSSAATTISNALGSGNVTLETTASGSTGPGNSDASGNGDIHVNSGISWGSDNTLTMNAYRDININADITVSGNSAGLTMNPGQGTAGTVFTGNNGEVSFLGSSPTLIISGNTYTLIGDAASLQAMGTTGNFALSRDIDASSISNFLPIGHSTTNNNSSPTAFDGVFDGLGHSVSRVNINRQSDYHTALLSMLSEDSILRNMAVSGTVSGRTYVGILVGLNSRGKIYNISASGNVSGLSEYAGGIVGYNVGAYNTDRGIIRKSSSSVRVTGERSVGGLAGENNNAIIIDSFATGDVYGRRNNQSIGVIGGLVGTNYASGAKITRSYATGNVNGDDGSSQLGGLVGQNNGGIIELSYATGTVSAGTGSTYVGGFAGVHRGVIDKSYSSGNVTGSSYVGGFVGRLDQPGTTSNSYSTGTVTGTSNVGGFAGHLYYGGGTNQTILENSYAVGRVSGTTAAGLVARLDVGGTISNSYWDTQTTEQSASAGGTGLTTAQMKQQSSFSGWDFSNVWTMPGGSYPSLQALPRTTNSTPNTSGSDARSPSGDHQSVIDGITDDIDNNHPPSNEQPPDNAEDDDDGKPDDADKPDIPAPTNPDGPRDYYKETADLSETEFLDKIKEDIGLIEDQNLLAVNASVTHTRTEAQSNVLDLVAELRQLQIKHGIFPEAVDALEPAVVQISNAPDGEIAVTLPKDGRAGETITFSDVKAASELIGSANDYLEKIAKDKLLAIRERQAVIETKERVYNMALNGTIAAAFVIATGGAGSVAILAFFEDASLTYFEDVLDEALYRHTGKHLPPLITPNDLKDIKDLLTDAVKYIKKIGKQDNLVAATPEGPQFGAGDSPNPGPNPGGGNTPPPGGNTVDPIHKVDINETPVSLAEARNMSRQPISDVLNTSVVTNETMGGLLKDGIHRPYSSVPSGNFNNIIQGPHKFEGDVLRFKTGSNERYVRLFGYQEGGNFADVSGSFLIPARDLYDNSGARRSPSELKRIYGLPSEPEGFADAIVSEGTDMAAGRSAGKGFFDGGGLALHIIDHDDKINFRNINFFNSKP